MVKYRNSKFDEVEKELEEQDAEQKLLNTPAVTVEEEQWKKRYGDLRRYVDQVKNESKTQIDELKRQYDQALRGQVRPPKSDEEVDAWMQQYPEFASILGTLLAKRDSQRDAEMKEKLTKLEQKQAQLDAQEAIAELKKLHPDFEKLARSEDFHNWLKEQDQSARDAIYDGYNVKRADLVIKAYKADKKYSRTPKINVDEEFDNRTAAATVRTPVSAEPSNFDFGDYEYTESQIDRESRKNARWYEANEAKITEALRRGKVLFDLSGAAR